MGNQAVNLIRQKQQCLATIHEQLGHLSFSWLRLLAKARLIPHDLASVDPPTCPGCAYGKAHRKPWRHKGTNRRPIKPATSPGQVVSIDQLISPTEGFVPTHRGTPTTLRYQGATVFVDHFSDFTYVHLIYKMDGESTVEAKLAFERVASSHGVNVLHYHADNGLFDSKVFKESVAKGNQTLSFCGVNAHHQNGRAEARIKDITTNARTALLHAAHCWPKAIHASLWPSALKNYTNIRNALPTEFVPAEKQGRSTLSAQYDIHRYPNSPGPRLNPTWTNFIHLGRRFMSWKIICKPIMRTTNGVTALELVYSSATLPAMLRVFPLFWILKPASYHLSFIAYTITSLTLADGMPSSFRNGNSRQSSKVDPNLLSLNAMICFLQWTHLLRGLHHSHSRQWSPFLLDWSRLGIFRPPQRMFQCQSLLKWFKTIAPSPTTITMMPRPQMRPKITPLPLCRNLLILLPGPEDLFGAPRDLSRMWYLLLLT
jgi:hypothetical protein